MYSTLLGGTYEDRATAVAVDSSGSAYVTGSTYSADFPVANARQAINAGGQDAFVARISADGASLLFSTYLGGSGGSLGYPEAGQALALDSQGNAYVAGVTSSADFPLLHPFQSSTLRRPPTPSFPSSTPRERCSTARIWAARGWIPPMRSRWTRPATPIVAGQTFSRDLPVSNATQPASGGDYDAFTAKLGSAGDTLPFLSYLGGAGSDTATAVALDASGNAYVAGWTLSPNFPVVAGYQAVNAGSYGGFVAKIAAGAPPSVGGISPNSGTGRVPDIHFAVLRSARGGRPDHRVGVVQQRNRNGERLLSHLYQDLQHACPDDRCGHRTGRRDHTRQRDTAEQPMYVERRGLQRRRWLGIRSP